MKEEWRDVPGFGGHYRVSSKGRVMAKRRTVSRRNKIGKLTAYNYRARLLRPNVSGPYHCVHIGVDNKRMNVPVHHMVLLAFHGPRPAGHCGCHTDGNSANNHPDNLRWDTHHGNMADRQRHGNYPKGEKHPMAKLTDAQTMEVRNSSLSLRLVAAAYGISKTQAARIRRRPSATL